MNHFRFTSLIELFFLIVSNTTKILCTVVLFVFLSMFIQSLIKSSSLAVQRNALFQLVMDLLLLQ